MSGSSCVGTMCVCIMVLSLLIAHFEILYQCRACIKTETLCHITGISVPKYNSKVDIYIDIWTISPERDSERKLTNNKYYVELDDVHYSRHKTSWNGLELKNSTQKCYYNYYRKGEPASECACINNLGLKSPLSEIYNLF